MAIGARMKVASRWPDRNDSFSSGQPPNRTGSNHPLRPVLCSLTKCVTGQVRWQVTGMKPTRNRPPAGAGWRASNAPRLSHRWRTVTAASQAVTASRTFRGTGIGGSTTARRGRPAAPE